jgi:hypothetical protein
VKPHVVRLAYFGQRGEGIERALYGGSGCGVEEEGCLAPVFAFLDEAFEFRGDDLSGWVDGYADDGRGSKAVEVGGFFDRVVPVGRGEEFELESAVALGFGRGVQGVASDDNGCGVGSGAPGLRDAATCAGWEVEEGSEIFGGSFLNERQYGGYLVDVGLSRELVLINQWGEYWGFMLHLC